MEILRAATWAFLVAVAGPVLAQEPSLAVAPSQPARSAADRQLQALYDGFANWEAKEYGYFENGRGETKPLDYLPRVDAASQLRRAAHLKMLLDRLNGLHEGQGLVLDGFPRTLPQATALDEALAGRGKAIDRCILITAPDDVLLERMMGRAKASGRADDTPEAMQTRLKGMKPPEDLLDHYRRARKLVDVDGTPDVETVTKSIVAALGVGAEAR